MENRKKLEIEKTDPLYNPGPGHNNVNTKNRPSSARYTMRAKPVQKNLEVTPCPGNYNIRNEKQLTAPSYILGKDKKICLEYDNARYVPVLVIMNILRIYFMKNILNFHLGKN